MFLPTRRPAVSAGFCSESPSETVESSYVPFLIFDIVFISCSFRCILLVSTPLLRDCFEESTLFVVQYLPISANLVGNCMIIFHFLKNLFLNWWYSFALVNCYLNFWRFDPISAISFVVSSGCLPVSSFFPFSLALLLLLPPFTMIHLHSSFDATFYYQAWVLQVEAFPSPVSFAKSLLSLSTSSLLSIGPIYCLLAK